jgi:N-acetylmuramoyl-L-alanine amidase
MGRLKYLVIHCTATRRDVHVTADDIRRWHTSPPPEGRGWKRVGYSNLILLDGTIDTLVPNDYDGHVQPWEITNGAAGFNSRAIHVCYVGGLSSSGIPEDTRTLDQIQSLRYVCMRVKMKVPWIMIVGHSYLNPLKSCPCFDVDSFVKTLWKH